MFPCSVEDIDNGSIHEAIDQMSNLEYHIYEEQLKLSFEQKKADNLQSADYGYWLDNCGDDEWYCAHCLQPECCKRMAKCNRVKNGGYV